MRISFHFLKNGWYNMGWCSVQKIFLCLKMTCDVLISIFWVRKCQNWEKQISLTYLLTHIIPWNRKRPQNNSCALWRHSTFSVRDMKKSSCCFFFGIKFAIIWLFFQLHSVMLWILRRFKVRQIFENFFSLFEKRLV